MITLQIGKLIYYKNKYIFKWKFKNLVLELNLIYNNSFWPKPFWIVKRLKTFIFFYYYCLITILVMKIILIYINYIFRQDRYILIEDCKPLVDFYVGLIEVLGRMSFQLSNKNTLTMDSSWKHHPYKSTYQTYASEAKKNVINYYDSHMKRLNFEHSNITFINHLCYEN
jgi:hypothetical protein